jgi:hypothetical protein
MRERLLRFRDSLSPKAKLALLAGCTGVAVLVTALVPRMAQPKGYHSFADTRTLLGVPFALDALSNAGFLVVGVAGLWWLARGGDLSARFRDPRERWPVAALFLGLVTTTLGSTYYHLDPNNQTLVFDRLGMVVGFMALVPIALGERVSPGWGVRLLLPMIALGIASVLYWGHTEQVGAGDLRWYGLAQGYAFLATAGVLLLTRPTYDRQSGWLLAFGCYALAKVTELADQPIYWVTGHLISGHTLKHLAAALGGYFVLRMFATRTAVVPARVVQAPEPVAV